MKFTLSWLKDHLETDASIEEISSALTMVGLEVEGVTDKAEDFAPFIVARIEDAKPHPDADKLQVCQVNTGSETLEVVCGAPNARAGLYGIFAPIGSTVPANGLLLTKAKIRGVESSGMMMSEAELGIGEGHDGIIELNGAPELGTPAASALGLDDPMIEIDITPNRGDCASVYGIARDLAAAGLGTLKPHASEPVPATTDASMPIEIKLPKGHEHECPLFIGRMITGVKNGPSPQWLADKLKAVGLKPISALVDITNYFTLTYGRPLHVYDADTLAKGIIVRHARDGEELEALDDKHYTLKDGMVAIADHDGVLGLGGVIGGEPSGCTDDTVNVLLETALFDPISIAMTGRALTLDTDARYRFERGIDPEFAMPGMEMATRMILDLCGGEAGAPVVAGDIPEWQRGVHLKPDLVQHLTGVSITHDEQLRILQELGFAVTEKEDGFHVAPPSWRPDIGGPADLVEEILRIYGYDKIPLAMPVREDVTKPAVNEAQRRQSRARRMLAMRGMEEAITYSFIDEDLAEKFGDINEELRLINPISADLSIMRPSVLASLASAAIRNADRGTPDVAIFELGPAYRDGSDKGQDLVAGGIRQGDARPRNWAGDKRAVDLFDVKADALALLDELGAPVENLQIRREAPKYYHPGRSASLCLGKAVLAHFGELHPMLRDEMDARHPIAGFEVYLNAIPVPRKKGTAKPAADLPQFQPVHRDFAFIVNGDVMSADLVRAAKGSDAKLISDVTLFDDYSGKGVEEGKRSLAIQVTLQPREKTLTDAEIDAVAAKIVASVEKRTGGMLRG